MRRPHPRFDSHRNAWVTNAGGKLKILVSGPKNAKTEASAWDAFYEHMARLGQPVQNSGTSTITLGKLADEYGQWIDREIANRQMAPATKVYYVNQLQRFLDAVGGRRRASTILPIELERFKTGWHSVQTVQRLFNWGVKMGLLQSNPLKGIQRPPAGERERILTPSESVKLLRATDKHFRLFLLAQRHTIARPQEIRAVKWKNLILDPVPAFVLTDFKGKKLRKGRKGLRVIPLDARMLRLLVRLKTRRPQARPDDYIFLNRDGNPWTKDALKCRMSRLREKVGLKPDENGEQVVCYTMRHTGATRATASGVRDRTLADLMGHTSTETTSRYQHLQNQHLQAAIEMANKKFS